MSDRYARVVAEFCDQVWAILPGKLAAMTSLLQLRAAGLTLTDADIQARIGDSHDREDAAISPGGIGVIPIFGVLAQRMNLMSAISGGTSTEALAAEFRAMRDDPKVKGILFAVDSPGGSAYGVDELATEIRAARGNGKPIIAAVSSMGASGAYWLASQADQVFITPGGDVGSIGVFNGHQDISAAQEKLGVKTTLVSAGPYKTEGNPFEPLTDEARAAMQARVDACYERFVGGVALGRHVPEAIVRENYGGGRLLNAKNALAAGMVDGIATFDAVLARMEANVPRPQPGPLAASTSSSLDATSQEPSPATDQERRAGNLQWQQRTEIDLLRLES